MINGTTSLRRTMAALVPRAEAIDAHFHLDRVLGRGGGWDVVFTAEGSIDAQSAQGKMTVEVARRAREAGVPVVALTGTVGAGAEGVYEEGIAAFSSILDGPLTLEQAMGRGGEMLEGAAERTMRMLMVGLKMGAAKREDHSEQMKRSMSIKLPKPAEEAEMRNDGPALRAVAVAPTVCV